MRTDEFKLHHMLHSADLLDETLRHRLGRLGLRPRQARVIDALARMEPASQVALAREFGVTPAAMSTMTARLIEGGYATREVDPKEARAHLLRLTERGRGLLDEIHKAWRDVDGLIEEKLGPDGAATLSELARDLRDALGGRVPGTAPAATKHPPERTAS